MKTVITYGTYDLLHIGHINLLRRAKEMGDYLIVGLSTDTFNSVKHKTAFLSYEHRKEILEAIRYVDKVIPEETWEQKIEDIKKYKVDIFVMGDDWKGKFDFLKEFCEVVYLERTKDISTSFNELPRSKLRGIEKKQGSYTPMQASRNSLIKDRIETTQGSYNTPATLAKENAFVLKCR